MPLHNHLVMASTNTGNSQTAAGNVLGVVAGRLYTDLANLTTLTPATIQNVGGSQAHPNMQPFLTLSFCIALQGIFPSQN
jgi:microcystin-dependent protein